MSHAGNYNPDPPLALPADPFPVNQVLVPEPPTQPQPETPKEKK